MRLIVYSASLLVLLANLQVPALASPLSTGVPVLKPPATAKTRVLINKAVEPVTPVEEVKPPQGPLNKPRLHEGSKETYIKYFEEAINIESTDQAKADLLLTKCIEIDPSVSDAYHQRGLLRQKMGRRDEAIADFTRFIELNPNVTAGYVNRGINISDSGDQQEAYKDFAKAVDINEKNAKAWLGIGMTYLRSGDAKGSLEYTSKAIALDPSDHWGWNNRACAYGALHMYNKALADENKAIELNPQFGHHYFKRGLIKKALGNKAAMESDFATARKLGFDVDGRLAQGQDHL